MANSSSARKAARINLKRAAVNKQRLSKTRTLVKKAEEAIAEGPRDRALDALKIAEKTLMRTAAKGVVHKNSASRKISRLAKRLNSLQKLPPPSKKIFNLSHPQF